MNPSLNKYCICKLSSVLVIVWKPTTLSTHCDTEIPIIIIRTISIPVSVVHSTAVTPSDKSLCLLQQYLTTSVWDKYWYMLQQIWYCSTSILLVSSITYTIKSNPQFKNRDCSHLQNIIYISIHRSLPTYRHYNVYVQLYRLLSANLAERTPWTHNSYCSKVNKVK